MKKFQFSLIALAALSLSSAAHAATIDPKVCNTAKGAAQAAVNEAESELHGSETCTAESVQIEGPISTGNFFPEFHVTVKCENSSKANPMTLNFTAETHLQGIAGRPLPCVSFVTPTGQFTSHAQREGKAPATRAVQF
jgi:hypothetical protein